MELELLLLGFGSILFLILTIGIVLFWRQGQQAKVVAGLLQDQEELMREQDEVFRTRMNEEMRNNRQELGTQISEWSNSVQQQLSSSSDVQSKHLDQFSSRLDGLTKSTEERMEAVRRAVESRLMAMQHDNASKLEAMRLIVDEKLHATLERRLGESFQLVSDRLEKVHKGIGEMQTLAANVGDLKKVMTQVKTRGIWGEMQLTRLLEEFFPRQIWEENVATRPGRSERVEVAIRIPIENSEEFAWLPIDAKFPMEDYEKLIMARENGELGEEHLKAMESRIRQEAKSIREKYIETPHTTDFALMFLPTESLYAEVISRTHLVEEIQNKERVIIVGPTNLCAFLSSLQMGFRALVVERQTGEILQLLGGVKNEMGRFAGLLEKTQKKIQEAGNHIGQAAQRGRAIERQLRNVEAIDWTANPELEEMFVEPESVEEVTEENLIE